MRGKMLAGGLDLGQMVAWYLYAAIQKGLLKPPLHLAIARIKKGEQPPKKFIALANLSWELWRCYASLLILHPATRDSFRDAPMFEDWFGEYVESTSRKQYLESVRRKVTFHAENVHTFAWSASPDFIYEHGKYKDTDINVLYRPFDAYRWHKKTLKDAYSALDWLDKKFGPYGYPQVTVIDGNLSGGMEYPMLVMDQSADESLALHEIGHIYFYGMLGNNEMDEAWLDEGFTTQQAFAIKDKLVFIDIAGDQDEHVYPMAIKGGAMKDMVLSKTERT